MRAHAHPLIGIVGVAGAMALGVYAVAVLEAVIGRRIARRSAPGGGAWGAPIRWAALRLLQRRAATERADGPAWALAPALLGGLGAVAVVVVPLAPDLAVADVGGGIVLFGAAMALITVAVFLHGWSPNSAFPLIGGYRFVAQALSFEIPLVLVLIAAAIPAESLAVGDIVRSQASLWNIVRQPLGLPIYLVAGLGVAFWGPLALPDAEDLSGGTVAEASGAFLLVWRVARAAVLTAVAAMGAAAFLGGWLGPWLPGPVWVALKTLVLLALLVGSGHLFARVRLESFVVFAWVILIPLALADVFLSGILVL